MCGLNRSMFRTSSGYALGTLVSTVEQSISVLSNSDAKDPNATGVVGCGGSIGSQGTCDDCFFSCKSLRADV